MKLSATASSTHVTLLTNRVCVLHLSIILHPHTCHRLSGWVQSVSPPPQADWTQLKVQSLCLEAALLLQFCCCCLPAPSPNPSPPPPPRSDCQSCSGRRWVLLLMWLCQQSESLRDLERDRRIRYVKLELQDMY